MTRLALTLVELIAVLCILVALSLIAIPLSSDQVLRASDTTTRAILAEVQVAMQQYWHDTKFIGLDGINTIADESDRFQIGWLFRNPVTNNTSPDFDPNTGIGWNGPYLLSTTSANAQPGLVDGWGRTLEVQYVNPAASLKDVRVVSAGADGVLETPIATPTTLLTPDSIGDDIYVAIMLR